MRRAECRKNVDKPSKWVTLDQTFRQTKKVRPVTLRQQDALFECPCDAEHKEEAEKHMLISLWPHIGGLRHNWIASHRTSEIWENEPIRAPSFSDITTNPVPRPTSFGTLPTASTRNSPCLNFSVVIPVLNRMNIGVEHRYEYCHCDRNKMSENIRWRKK